MLISGPSGSSKTTTAHLVSGILEKECGIKSHAVSLDSYFLPTDMMADIPPCEDGSPDLESPLRVDLALLAEHISELNEYRPIQVPVFDFKTRDRAGSNELRRSKGEIIIFEGIHALNPLVTGNCGDIATMVYVSVRTRIRCSNGTLLHPRYIRLMRRLSRDKLFRGRPLEQTFKMFASVSRGENLYILPHKHRADIEVDTFIPYEAAVFRSVLFDEMNSIKEDMSHRADFKDIFATMREIAPMSADYLSGHSLPREFIGGSDFE